MAEKNGGERWQGKMAGKDGGEKDCGEGWMRKMAEKYKSLIGRKT